MPQGVLRGAPAGSADFVYKSAMINLLCVKEIKIAEKDSEISEIPTAIFKCQRLRFLALTNFLLTSLSDRFGGFSGLTTLDLYKVELKDRIIELMLQLCPGLKLLILRNCNGLERLKICSKSLIALSISSEIRAITANCPQLTSLIILLDNTETCIHKGKYSDTDFSRRDDEAILPLENLKGVHLNITYFHDPVPLLSCLFRVAPALKTLLISRKEGFDGVNALRFINLAWNLQRPSTETKVFLSRHTAKEERCFDCDLVNFICERDGIFFFWLILQLEG
ncbi:hypothetical protein SUGI_0352870 [Cryptomeria japonica]|nr:hypothetical protein SUGI_0352870 [Cryptomeria japonica]